MSVKLDQLDNIWKLVLKKIENKTEDRTSFNSLISPCYLESLTNSKAVLIAPHDVAKKILNENFYQLILNELNDVTESNFNLEILSKNEIQKKTSYSSYKQTNNNYFENCCLQQKYTFNNFVVGKSNKEAYDSATFIASNQAKFNPLFIYSKSGLGKTHLMCAIGNYVKNKFPEKKVLYITSNDFVDEFVKFVRGDSDKEPLKEFFRGIDYLLIDDIQFLANKTQTEVMFFNIFNLLVDSNKQIVITSDTPPNLLSGLEERLVTRFAQGLTVSIDKPEKATLIEILKMKIKSNGFNPDIFEDDALDYLANSFSNDIRSLEGALNRILFFNVTSNNLDNITLEIVKQAFYKENEHVKKGEKITAEKIISVVSRYYNLTETQLLSNVRTNQISLVRAIAMYLCRSILNLSTTSIATSFHKKDHTTVLAAYKKVDNLLKTDDAMKKAIKQLTNQLKA